MSVYIWCSLGVNRKQTNTQTELYNIDTCIATYLAWLPFEVEGVNIHSLHSFSCSWRCETTNTLLSKHCQLHCHIPEFLTGSQNDMIALEQQYIEGEWWLPWEKESNLKRRGWSINNSMNCMQCCCVPIYCHISYR